MSEEMTCPKCFRRGMPKDNRASSNKMEIWTCLYIACRHTLRIPLETKDGQIQQLKAELALRESEIEMLDKEVDGLKDKLDKKDELLFAYESVRAPKDKI